MTDYDRVRDFLALHAPSYVKVLRALKEDLAAARQELADCRSLSAARGQDAQWQADALAAVRQELQEVRILRDEARIESIALRQERDRCFAQSARLREALTVLLDRCSNTDPANDEQVYISGYEFWAARAALAATTEAKLDVQHPSIRPVSFFWDGAGDEQ